MQVCPSSETDQPGAVRAKNRLPGLMGSESMTVTYLRLSVSQIRALQCVALNKIDPNYVDCV